MSGLPSGIEVVRHVPLHLVEDFRKGAVKLWGGEMRRLDGTIAGFLTEGPDLIRRAQHGSPIEPTLFVQAVGDAKLAAQLASGIGLVNLGVQVAGFAMVARRLDGIGRQIEAVCEKLRAVGEDTGWLRANALAGLRADAAHALAVAERAERRAVRALFDEAKSKADRTRRHLVELLDGMSAGGRLLAQHGLFEELTKMAVLLAATEARCDDAAEGPGQAARDLASSAAPLRARVDHLAAKARDFRSSPRELLLIGDAGREALKASVRAAKEAVARLEGHIPQLHLQDVLGLDAAGWTALVTAGQDHALACLTFSGTDGAALANEVSARRAGSAA